MFDEESINNLRRSIREGRPVTGPLDVQILPTSRCNAGCVFCPLNCIPEALMHYTPRFTCGGVDLPGGLLDRLADDLYHLGGLRRLTITGGEPLLYNLLVPAVFQFTRSFENAELSVVTNGLRLHRFAGFLARSGLSGLTVSLNAGTPETYRQQNPRASADTFDDIMEAVAALSREKKKAESACPHVTLSVVLSSYSAGDVEPLFEAGKRTGANAITFIPLMRFMIEGHESNRDHRVSAEGFRRFLDELDHYSELARREGFYLGYAGSRDDQGVLDAGGLYERQPCYAGYAFAAVFPNGDVRPCCHCEPVMGNLKESSFTDIWRSERYQEYRERMLKIEEKGLLPGCLCNECGYLFENEQIYRGLGHE
ncbi:MAG: radical SAM protein [bacterium]